MLPLSMALPAVDASNIATPYATADEENAPNFRAEIMDALHGRVAASAKVQVRRL
jgi:hypothetical protein